MTVETAETRAGKVPARLLQARATAAYASQSRDALEEQWILQHLPLVRHIVNKVVESTRSRNDYDDLISAGTVGLVKAARSFDTSRDVAFKTYAYIRVRGAVIDELRSRSFTPAAMFGLLRRIEESHQRLAGELGRMPEDAELASAVGLTVEKLYK